MPSGPLMDSIYLNRYAHPQPLIRDKPADNLSMVVVIPCYAEPELIHTLKSLAQCSPTKGSVEVLVVINESTDQKGQVPHRNKQCYQAAVAWAAAQQSPLVFHILYEKLPSKYAGVGLARKLGMDEAVRRFESLHKDGVIVSLDADCTCAPNYLSALEQHFITHPRSPGCSIYFEHPLAGPLDPCLYKGIAAYELHLRYYTHAMRYAGHPFSFQTVGSAMAVRSGAYQKQGGMNKRRAGEDFYFLQKIFLLGNFSELTGTKVIPSPRISNRVPFGTGKAMSTWVREKKFRYYTYNPHTFNDLRCFISKIDLMSDPGADPLAIWQELPMVLQGFLPQEEFQNKIGELRRHTASASGFKRRFFYWCNGFFVFKYAHYARDKAYNKVEVTEAASWILQELHGISVKQNVTDLLLSFRSLDGPSQQVK